MLLQIVCASLLIIQTFASQQISDNKNEHLPTLNEKLRSHNIGVKQPELLRALKNPDAEVRYLSALKLGELGAKDAVPNLEEALNAEKVDLTKVNIGLALAELGDEAGVTALGEGCQNSNWGAQARLQAVDYLLDLNRDTNICLNAILYLAENAPTGYRIQALSMMAKLHEVSPSDSQRIFEIVLEGLNEPTPALRMAASGAAAEMGNDAAVPALEKAIANEQEKEVRWQLERDLSKLKAKRNP